MGGPSLVILKEEVRPFKGKKILNATGYAYIDYRRLKNKTVKDFKTWGKHFLVVLPDFTLRIHFLLFGTYFINERKSTNPKLSLHFSNGQLHCYVCSVKFIEEPLKDVYDWEVDLLSPKWNFRKVKKLLLSHPDAMVCDVVLDPDIFSGSGNIIKNEALYRAGIHPQSIVKKIPKEKVTSLIKAVHSYSYEFLNARKKDELGKTWQVYSRKKCRVCGDAVQKKYTGKLKRRSFTCKNCQQLYR
jgi:endonuclease VIII